MAKVKEFDPKKTTVSLNAHSVVGYGKDTFLMIEFISDLYTTENDALGKSFRFKNNNYDALITLTLTQESQTNDVLSNFANLDRQLGTGVFTLTIKDNNSDSLYSSIGAHVQSVPTTAYGTSGNDREWKILASDLAFHIGGLK
jgi:arabinogalactan endo-1,4-beta-galactosidase